MNNKIAITNDIADLFIALSLKENFCWNLNHKGDVGHAEYIIENLTNQNCNISDLFSMLTHFLILYDKIELPIINNAYTLSGEITSCAKLKNDLLCWGFEARPWNPNQTSFSDEIAVQLKPYVISACMSLPSPKFLSLYASQNCESIEHLYNYMFDRLYNKESVVKLNAVIEDDFVSMLGHYYCSEIEPGSAENCILIVFGRIIASLKQLVLFRDLCKEEICDFYSPYFSGFHTATNTNDAYCILKNQISMIIDEQPAFDSLTDILRFRERRHRDIKLLRDEVSALNSLLNEGKEEQAIQKAIQDVRHANQALIKNTVAKKTARIVTYSSVPISLLEMFTFGTSYSMLIGVVGTSAQLIADYNDSKNNWLFVAR